MIKRILVSSFDHIVFTLSFILGVQLPEFMQQYTQLINGKLAEANFHLSKFQSVADLHFNGDIKLLMSRYKVNSDPAISQTGQMISELINRVDALNNQFIALTQNTYIERVFYFLTHFELDSATLTARHFVLAIPLSIEALITGVIFAIVIIILRVGLSSLFSAKKHRMLFNHQKREIS